ncbi:MAG TPA: hypothetical protein V6C85_08055 [Allocoleopsis sp.]
MKIQLGKRLSLLLGIAVALVIVFRSVPAQGSFVSTLPAGYVVYDGQPTIGKSCSCARFGITGAPPLPPPCADPTCRGSSNTQYVWFKTNVSGIKSTICKSSRPCFQLDGSDALVVSGNLSPVQNLTYYSFTIYQSYTHTSRSPSQYTEIGSSVGLSPNRDSLKLDANGKYVLIITASTNTLNAIKNSLRATGVPDQIINSYLIPASIANVGSTPYPDQLALALRLTSQSDTERKYVESFVKQTAPLTQVLFIKAPGINGDITFDNLPKWEDTLRVNNVEYRTGTDQKLKELEQAVTKAYNRQGYKLKARLTEDLLHFAPEECRKNLSFCQYDSPDALYTNFSCDFAPFPPLGGRNCNIQLSANSNDVLMLLGVNHTLVGDKTLATYISHESKTTQSNDSTFTFVGLYTKGSANQYLPTQKSANLYAVKITRNCDNELFCVGIPYVGRKPENTGFYLLGRIYLDKVSKSGPNPANLVPSVLLWFTRS